MVQAKYDAVNLLIQRDQVSREIRMGLEERAEEFHLKIEDVAIVTLTMSWYAGSWGGTGGDPGLQ